MRNYLIIFFFLPAIGFSETSVWKISKSGYELFIGGTIHVLKNEDYPLPPEYYEAFRRADTLILEANIEKAKTQDYGKKVASMLSYPAGQSLKGSIKEDTFNQLKKYLADRHIPIESFLQYKPQMIVLILTVIELKKMGMVDIGVDEYFHNKAKQSGLKRVYFETVDEQLEFIRTMGKGNEDSMLLSTIRDMSRIQNIMSILKAAWLRGDEQIMVETGLADMMKEHPETYQSLLVKRNNNWMPKIERMLNNKNIELILVGALHLVGKDGLLQQLRNKNYTVEKLKLK